jgi:hypothetical protein
VICVLVSGTRRNVEQASANFYYAWKTNFILIAPESFFENLLWHALREISSHLFWIFTSLKTRHKSINPSSAPYSHPETHYEMNLCPFFHSIKDLSFQSRLFFFGICSVCALWAKNIFFLVFFSSRLRISFNFSV